VAAQREACRALVIRGATVFSRPHLRRRMRQLRASSSSTSSCHWRSVSLHWKKFTSELDCNKRWKLERPEPPPGNHPRGSVACWLAAWDRWAGNM
jgi:hypothetical protein